jgi:hypothetical protein
VRFKLLNPSQKAEFWDALRMVKRPARQTKAERWEEAVDALHEIQRECEAYADDVPDGLKDEDRQERYRIIAEIDLSELENAEF